eukprot:11973753-Alexandrium_andersonii.AAC.1
MSASLVGSEMCIRDRSFSVGQCQLAPVGLRQPLPESDSASQVSVNGVSYTHLTLPTICSV